MKFTGKDEDVRGQRWNFQDNGNLISLFEIKKGFSRGGQYHENEVTHVLISGKIEYRRENVLTGKEEIGQAWLGTRPAVGEQHWDFIANISRWGAA